MTHPYRASATPSPSTSNLVIELPALPRHRATHMTIVAAVAMWFVTDGVAGALDALATGHDPWRLPLTIAAWLLLTPLLVRLTRRETLLISEEGIRQLGVLRDRFVRWDALEGVRRFDRVEGEHPVPVIGVSDGERELHVTEGEILDASGTLDWVLAAASEQRLADVRARVRSEGRPRFCAGYVAAALAFSLVVGATHGHRLWSFDSAAQQARREPRKVARLDPPEMNRFLIAPR